MTEERIVSSTGGEKCSKPARFDLLDSSFLWKVAEVMGYGCVKYSPHNWRLGYDWGLSMSACQRHLHQFWQGEDDDQESGLPHLAHACFHLMVMWVFSQGIQYRKFDSRFSDGPELMSEGEVVVVPDFPQDAGIANPLYIYDAPIQMAETYFPLEVAHETIEDLDRSLADTVALPVVQMCPDGGGAVEHGQEKPWFRGGPVPLHEMRRVQMGPDSTDASQLSDDAFAKFRGMVLAGSKDIELEVRTKRAVEVGDRMEKMLTKLKGDQR